MKDLSAPEPCVRRYRFDPLSAEAGKHTNDPPYLLCLPVVLCLERTTRS